MILNKKQRNLLFLIKKGFRSQLINKVLIYGRTGIGKTTFVEEIRKKLLKRNVRFLSDFLDYRLGKSIKNIKNFFIENKNQIIVLDEIDGIARDRNSNDVEEIKRVLNELFSLMDKLKRQTFLLAITNMKNVLDPAFIRRFDLVENFDVYEIADYKRMTTFFFKKYKFDNKEIKQQFLNSVKKNYKNISPAKLEKNIKITKLKLDLLTYKNSQSKEELYEDILNLML